MNKSVLTAEPVEQGDSFFRLWINSLNNPIVWKNYKSRMRIQALFPCLLVFVLSAFMTLTIYYGVDRIESNSIQAARTAILPLGILQWIIMMLLATSRITSGIIHERVSGTIDYTRLTPLSPLAKVVGYLFGLPIREYALFIITMPFMLFLLIKGQIPFAVIFSVYLVFLSSALLCHLIGTVFGLVLKQWRLSVALTMGVVIIINWVLPLFSYMGFPFLRYLTVRPVVVEQLFPYLSDNSIFVVDIPGNLFSSSVTFFDWNFSITGFSLLVQCSIVFTLGLMVYRKWEDNFKHALSKPYSLAFFIALQFFCIGTMWPYLTLQSSSALGMLSSGFSPEELAFLLPMVYSIFILLVAFCLLYVITPTHDEYREGLLRLQKLANKRMIESKGPATEANENINFVSRSLSVLGDYSSNAYSAGVFALIACVLLLFVQLLLINSGALESVSIMSFDFFKLPLCVALIIIYFAIALEFLGIRKMAVLLLLGWVVPMLLAIFIAVAFAVEEQILYVAALSPIIILFLSLQGLLDAGMDANDFAVVSRAFYLGVGVTLLITVAFAYRLAALKRSMVEKIALVYAK